jgi:hypothetical protein
MEMIPMMIPMKRKSKDVVAPVAILDLADAHDPAQIPILAHLPNRNPNLVQSLNQRNAKSHS